MDNTSSPLQKSKAPSASEAAKHLMERPGTSPKSTAGLADKIVIQLLNLKSNSVTKRVTSIIEACRDAIQLTERITHSSVQGTEGDTALKEERHGILTALNARLSRYEWNPVVRNCVSTNSYFDVSFEAGPNPVLAKPRRCSERIDFNTPSGAAFFENRAVQWIVHHISAVHRIRRCHRLQCRKWFFAVTDHQKYCGDACRKRDASQGESFKQKRRDYMKRYRSEEAERDSKAKKLVKGKSK